MALTQPSERSKLIEALRNLYVSACDTRKGYADRDLHEPWPETKIRAYAALIAAQPDLVNELEAPE